MAAVSAMSDGVPAQGGGGRGLFRDLTIRVKLLLGFAVVLALLAVVAASGVASLLVAFGALDRYRSLVEQVEIADSILARFLKLRGHAREYSISGDPADAAKVVEGAQYLRADFDKALKAFPVAERRKLVEEMSNTFDDYLANFTRGQELQEESVALVKNHLDPTGRYMMETLDAVLERATRSGNTDAVASIRDAREHALQGRLYANIVLGRRDPAYAKKTENEFDKMDEIVVALEARLTAPEDRWLLGALKVSSDAYEKAFQKLTENEAEIRTLSDKTMFEQERAIGRLVDDLDSSAHHEAERTRATAESAERTARLVMLGFGAGGILLGLVLAWLLGNGISAPVVAVTAVLERLARGDFTAEIPGRERGDEIGKMAAAAQVFKETALDNVRLAAERERAVERSEADRRQLERRVRELAVTQAKLMRLNDALIRSNNDLDDFAHIASHDLKEPLRGIHNYSNFLLEDYTDKLDADGKRRLETLTRLTRRMDVLIEDLLTYSRLGRAELAMRETDVEAVVRDVIGQMRISLDERGVEMRIPGPLPKIRCDHVRIGEVFRNLISNAANYNDKAEKWIEIGCVNGEKAGVAPGQVGGNGETAFYVRDNGIGIPERHFERVFKMFRRLHGRDKFGGGTGIGMSIARKIVERHGGEIWIESEVGSGTTFYFTLGVPMTEEI